MKSDVAAQLVALNRNFYEELADPFAESRLTPQPGFAQLAHYLPAGAVTLLDVGCGNGRFGHFLRQTYPITYTGVDFTTALLAKAQELLPDAAFWQRDMTQPDFLHGLGTFDVVACLAAMQHVPGYANRLRLLQEMRARLTGNGRLFLANWQFMDSVRQQRKVRDWAEIGLTPAAVEPGDYLLTWQRSGFGLRYACHIDAGQTARLAADAELRIVHQFRSDGKEGNLSLYTVLQK
ncbi:MAG: class I SAM-dependent methyltransferase [Anaerolineales bacterium]|nr:class I SAM-dependent methyltransferase [Anaerolineales bacterium]